MFSDLITFLQQTLQAAQAGLPEVQGPWIYALLLVLVALEGPFVTALAGAGIAAGILDPLPAWLAAVVGNSLSDWGWYSLGYLGKVPGFVRRRLRPDSRMAQELRQELHRHAITLLMAAKFTAGFGVATMVTLGMARIPWRRWALPLFLAECVRAAIMLTLGYALASSLDIIEHGLNTLVFLGVAVFVVMIGGWLWRRYRRGGWVAW